MPDLFGKPIEVQSNLFPARRVEAPPVVATCGPAIASIIDPDGELQRAGLLTVETPPSAAPPAQTPPPPAGNPDARRQWERWINRPWAKATPADKRIARQYDPNGTQAGW
jgi:hypothetical protein